MPPAVKRIVVIGGGITGLAAAHHLTTQAKKSERALELVLLEGSGRLGGSLHSTQRDGFLLEGGPDCFISNKPRGVRLCEELGLQDQLISTHPQFRRSFIVRHGKLNPVPEGFYLLAPSQLHPFLTSPIISWAGKWRALFEPLIPCRPQTDESLGSFVRRRMGREVLDWLAQPLLAGIYAADPETLSLRATFPQFVEMEKKFGSLLLGMSRRETPVQQASGARYSLFTSLRTGMETLVVKLKESLPPAAVRLQTRATSIERREKGWNVSLESGDRIEADAVCLCTGAPQAARLLAWQDRSLADQLQQIPHTASLTINLAYEAAAIGDPLNGVGFVTPHREAHPALACTFVHRKFDGRVPQGKTLLRAFLGGALQADYMDKEDRELVSLVHTQLAKLLRISSEPLWASVERWPNAMPQYTVGHLPRVAAIEEALLKYPGLSLAGNWKYGVGIPDCVESGERAASQLLGA